MMNYLSVNEVLKAAEAGNFNPGFSFELEGKIDVDTLRILKRQYGIELESTIDISSICKEAKLCTFVIGEPQKFSAVTLETIMQEMPRLVHTPMCFPGSVTEKTSEILSIIGFHCIVNTEEYITIVAKK